MHMAGSIISAAKRLVATKIFKGLRASYSQSGEDIIICDLFVRLGINKPTYLDIGTNDPVKLNNTYRLYKRGSRGVCVEPNTMLCKKIRAARKEDVCINAGIAFDNATEADFYLFPEKVNGLSTFSKEEAEFWEHTGNEEIGRHKPEQVLKIALLDINTIMDTNFRGHPNFISIDVEGLDLAILQLIDFEKHKPEVFCVETLGFLEGNKEIKKKDILEFFDSKGYFIYADTYINTIFCLRSAYQALA